MTARRATIPRTTVLTALYAHAGALAPAAADLGVPRRTLERVILRDPALGAELARLRSSDRGRAHRSRRAREAALERWARDA